MTTRPWDSHERPDEALVTGLLGAQFPKLADHTVAFFAEGWDFTVFRVGERWLFRFPKRAQTVPWMAREAAVLSRLEGLVPAPIPEAGFRGEPSEAFPFPFVGYERLRGAPLDVLALDAVDEDAARRLGSVVGETLALVHALPREILPPAPSPRDDLAAWIRTALDVLAGCSSLLTSRVVAAARHMLENPPAARPFVERGRSSPAARRTPTVRGRRAHAPCPRISKHAITPRAVHARVRTQFVFNRSR